MLALPIFLGRPSIVLPSQVSGGHLQAKKNPQPKLWVLCWRYLSSRVGQRIVLPYKKCPVDTFRQKKAPTFRSRLVCWHYLSSRVGQVLSCRNDSPVDCHRQKKSPVLSNEALCSRYLSSRAVTRQVLSAHMSLTSVFGMGTGGPS